jgi:outer membrane protein assembly factor BamB
VALGQGGTSGLTCTNPNQACFRWGDYSGLSPDPSLKDRVWGTNMIQRTDTGLWGTRNFSLLAAVPPGAPTGLVALADSGLVDLRWSPPASDGGSPITRYTVVATQSLNPPMVGLAITGWPVPTRALIAGLNPTLPYTFTVTAGNDVGDGQVSATSPAVVPGGRSAANSGNSIPPVGNRNPAPTSNPGTASGRAGAGQSRANDNSVSFQIDPAHTGAQPFDTTAPPFNPATVVKWSQTLPGTRVGYPIVADGRVFALSGTGGATDLQLNAFDEATGQTLWAPIPLGSNGGSLAYDSGRLFVTQDNGSIKGFAAATGTSLWSAFPINLSCRYLSVATGGVLYTPCGTGLQAIRESDGTEIWRLSFLGNANTPAVVDDTVYADWAGEGVAVSTGGSVLWTRFGNLSGGIFGYVPAVYEGFLYGREQFNSPEPGPPVFDARWGGLQPNPTFPASSRTGAAAFSGSIGFVNDNGVVRAIALASGVEQWNSASAAIPGLVTPPIVVNGYIYVGSSNNNLYAFNATTGTATLVGSAGAAFTAAQEGTVITSGLAAGGGMIVVPASNRLVAFGN